MTEQLNEPAPPIRRSATAAKDAAALLALCGLFAVLDVAGIIYVLMKRPGQQLTIWITFGGFAVLAMFIVLIFYIVTNPIVARPRSAARPTRSR